MNVILLLIDTLRPDHLGFSGYPRKTSPNIDAFAKEGVSFANTYCTLSRSEATMTSILTGLYPHTHGIRMVWGNRMDPSITTLQEILKSHGYITAFLKTGSAPHDGSEKGWDFFDVFSWKVANKIKRGIYKVFHPTNFIGVAEQKYSDAIRFVKKNRNNKFFLMVHTNDIHWPYPVPKPFEHMFDSDYKGDHDFATMAKGTMTRGELIFGIKKLPVREIQHAIAHYDAGIRYTDTHVGRFFDFLKKEGLYDNSLIIVMADHGENFGEHSFYFQHGASLYETSLKVPLVMRCPAKILAGKVVKARVQSLDIMPTVLDVLGIPLLDKIEGFSLLPLINGEKPPRDFIFTESIEEHFEGNKRVYMKGVKGKWRMMIVDGWKIIYIPHPEKDIFELYNLREDPNEEHNLIEVEKEKATVMKKRILDYVNTQDNEGEPKEEDLTSRARKMLIRAGYLEN